MSTDQLEARVVLSLEQILQKYQQMESLADSILADNTSLKTMDQKMIMMKQGRESVTQLQQESQPLHQQYRSSRQHASAAVNQLTEKIGNLMQGLLMKIGKLEQLAQAAGADLLPQINQGVRAVQMQNAYGKYQ